MEKVNGEIDSEQIKLTRYSHGAGCGCKISPMILDEILQSNISVPDNKNLLVGNSSRDDAAVYDLGNGVALISTTDFFMPIVDDPYDFGRIASANALSDVYAMGGKPVLAIAILGWPIDKLPAAVAQRVIEGSRSICKEAGIPLGGGHSIDSPEPIFGLAVSGLVDIVNLKKNNEARPGDILFLTKPIGVGILTTAEKKGKLKAGQETIAAQQMMQLNKIGEDLAKLKGVHALTDVTGFGLLGHLIEMAEGSNCSADLYKNKVPRITENIEEYILENCIPGGSHRNWKSYGEKVSPISENEIAFLADPQTSGGLLVSVSPGAVEQVLSLFHEHGIEICNDPIGKIKGKEQLAVTVI